MRNLIIEIIVEALPIVLGTIATAFVGWIGNKYAKLANTKIKKNVIADTVKYVEQVYLDIHGDEKLTVAKEMVIKLLKEKGISMSNDELTVLIESTVNEMNSGGLNALMNEVKNGGEE